MRKLSWQFVTLTSVAMVSTCVAGLFSDHGAMVAGGVALLYGQALAYGKTADVGIKTEELQEATASNSMAIQSAREEANRIAGFISSKVVKEAAKGQAATASLEVLVASSPFPPTVQEIASAVVAEIKTANGTIKP